MLNEIDDAKMKLNGYSDDGLPLPTSSRQRGGDPRFRALLDKAWEMHLSKGADYATEEDPLSNLRSTEDFAIEPWRYCLARMNEKMNRLKTYCQTGVLKNESVVEDLLDISSIGFLAMIFFEEERK